MEIKIKPQTFKCQGWWREKIKGVVLVAKEEDIEPLFKLLCEQDEYWEGHKELIKVAPSEINGVRDLSEMCDYVGKTDIYDIPKLKEQIDFLLYQEQDEW